MTSRLPFALDAAGHGWPVFPLRPGTKRPQAGFTNWESRATVDPERITHWWTRHPDDNVAIATGPAGLVVVDLDVAGAGERSPAEWPGARSGMGVYRALAQEHEHVPTWTVGTASGGCTSTTGHRRGEARGATRPAGSAGTSTPALPAGTSWPRAPPSVAASTSASTPRAGRAARLAGRAPGPTGAGLGPPAAGRTGT
jgi:Bifunctional DNA primase/polymerase, N-terminal